MSEIQTLPPPVLSTSAPSSSKWEREYQAFLRLLPELLRSHRSQYVAIHEEQVVDSGDDPIALIKRVHARIGYVPIHVDQVTDQPPAPLRIPHYREYRAKVQA
jgi:hypothetical protein